MVDPYRSGWTLRDFLAHRFRYHPSAIWRERIADGSVRVNGELAGEETRVSKGDRIEYAFVHAEPAVDFDFEVLHEDRDVLAVAKSGNLPVHAGGKFIRNTLIAHLREERGNELRLAHRLDRETSGVVLLAKTKEAARSLEREFHERRVEKVYHAVLRGVPPKDFEVQGAIARREPAEPPYFRVVDSAGKPARTRFVTRALGLRAQEPLTLVRAHPDGGRTNQIRVHAAHAGHPVLGDKIYGIPEELAREFVQDGDSERIRAAAGASRHLLHCSALAVRHPRTGLILRLRARLPRDFREALRPRRLE